MKTVQRMVLTGCIAVATVTLAGTSLAAGGGGGGKGPQYRGGQANGSAMRTETATQTRQPLRDGSCVSGTTGTTAAAAGLGTRQRLRDGSCLNNTATTSATGAAAANTGDRLRLRDGSCQTK